jgi:hypothetical protein
MVVLATQTRFADDRGRLFGRSNKIRKYQQKGSAGNSADPSLREVDLPTMPPIRVTYAVAPVGSANTPTAAPIWAAVIATVVSWIPAAVAVVRVTPIVARPSGSCGQSQSKSYSYGRSTPSPATSPVTTPMHIRGRVRCRRFYCGRRGRQRGRMGWPNRYGSHCACQTYGNNSFRHGTYSSARIRGDTCMYK